MNFSHYFPATAWIWGRLTSRLARRVWLVVCLGVLLTTTGLRLRSAYFQYHVRSILHGLSQVRLDRTTCTELMTLVPAFRPTSPTHSNATCSGEERFAAEMDNWPTGPFTRSDEVNEFVYKGSYWLGVRYWTFLASAQARDGVVRKISYQLRLADGTFGYPGIVVVAATSTRGYAKGPPVAPEDESPEYRVHSYPKWPEKLQEVAFTPAAPTELVGHAFDIRLNCLWSLRGCQTTQDLLPDAWADKQGIEQAAMLRLTGTDPCPDRILPHRARDVKNILLVEVERRYIVKSCDSAQCTRLYPGADYRLVEILKGEVDRPLKKVGHPFTVVVETYPYVEVRNPALDLLRPGSRVLMFESRSRNVDSVCEIVSATPSALATIRSALTAPASQVPERNHVSR